MAPPELAAPDLDALIGFQTTSSSSANEPFNTAAERALMAFLRPLRARPNPKQAAILDKARREEIMVNGIAITVFVWDSQIQGSPTVILNHGYATNAAVVTPFVQPLLDAGFRVLAPDHVAHGVSGGEWGDLKVFIKTLQILASGKRNQPLAGILGHSATACVAVMALVEDRRIPCPRLVVVSPAVRIEKLLEMFCRKNKIDVGLVGDMWRLVKERGILWPSDVVGVVEGEGGWRGRAEMLIVHDWEDRVVPLGDVQVLRDMVGDFKTLMTRGNGHWGVLEDLDVVRAVVKFFGGEELKEEGAKL